VKKNEEIRDRIVKVLKKAKEPMPYAPYVERLIEEHKQLSERLDKLVAFLEGETFKYLPSAEQVLLRLQRQQMTAYQSTLVQRLALLNIPT
jgi:hypothetical protein